MGRHAAAMEESIVFGALQLADPCRRNTALGCTQQLLPQDTHMHTNTRTCTHAHPTPNLILTGLLTVCGHM